MIHSDLTAFRDANYCHDCSTCELHEHAQDCEVNATQLQTLQIGVCPFINGALSLTWEELVMPDYANPAVKQGIILAQRLMER